jgi:flagellar protein FlbT
MMVATKSVGMFECSRGKTPLTAERFLRQYGASETGETMSVLCLELRAGDAMIVNGAPIRFRNKTRIELTAKARILFGKQIMPPDEADTPARRIYFALQTAYVGTAEERVHGLEAARNLIAEFKQATTSQLAREILDRALAAAEAHECYKALKLARAIIRHEDAILGRPGRIATLHAAA